MPPMDARTKRYLMHLINEQASSMIRDMLFEQSAPPPADDAPASAPDTGSSDVGSSAPSSVPAADMGSNIGDDSGGDMGSADGMNSVDQGMTGEMDGMSTDSGGGFGGLQGIGGGGGGDMGGDDAAGGDPSSDPSADGSGVDSNGPDSDPSDPIGEVMSTAEELVQSSDNVLQITKALKASIQVNFENYEDAWPLIRQLKSSDNETLRAVSRRLALFIAGV